MTSKVRHKFTQEALELALTEFQKNAVLSEHAVPRDSLHGAVHVYVNKENVSEQVQGPDDQCVGDV